MATDDYWIDVGRPELLLQANLDRLAGRYDTTLTHPVSGGNGVDPEAVVAIDALLSGSVVAGGCRDRVAVGRHAVGAARPELASAMMSSCRTPW